MNLNTTWNWLTTPHPSITSLEQRRQSRLLAMLLLALMFADVVAGLSGIINSLRLGSNSYTPLLIILTLAANGYALYLNKGGNYQTAAYIGVLSLFLLLILLPLLDANINPLFYFLTGIFLSVILLNWQITRWLVIACFVFLVGYIATHPKVSSIPTQGPLVFLIVNMAILFAFIRHRNELEKERQQELRDANEKLRESEASLEKRVAARTRDLEIAADVSKQINTILDLNELLDAIVERTKAGFGLYHASVFLYDEATQMLTLEAGAGEVGKVLKAAGKHFHVPGDHGLVPTAARTRTAVLVNDVTQDSRFHANPHLPQTRAELALPMIVVDEVVGVLDFQSEQVNRFSADDVRVMTTLAEQIAIAVENAHLYAQQLQVAQQLREIDELKSRFLASMSHELRTPLNAILNFTKFVSSGMLGTVNEKQVEALNKTTNSGKHLLALINDVLDITKIESGMLNLFVEADVNLQLELETVVATAETLLSEKPTVRFVPEIPADLPSVIADKRRIRQILLNLVSNACKFTEQGSVGMCVEVQGENILIVVKDTGPGIASEDQEAIFEAFRQTQVGLLQGGGTGLGLAIAKRLAEAHGGQLWLESVVDIGSTFFLQIPIRSEILKSQIVLPEGS